MIQGGLIQARWQWRANSVQLLTELSRCTPNAGKNHSAPQTHQPLTAGEAGAGLPFVNFLFSVVHMKRPRSARRNSGIPASQIAFAVLVRDVVASARGNRHDGERGLVATRCDEHGAVSDENVFHVVELTEAVDHASLRVPAHARRAALADGLAKTAQAFAGWLRILDLHGVEDFHHVVPHSLGHGVLVLAITRYDVQRGNAPGIFLFGVERDVVVVARQALTLHHHSEIIRNLGADSVPPIRAEPRQSEGLRVELLAAVTIKAISTQEALVDVFPRIDIPGDQEPARRAARFALERFELGQEPARTFQREMVHQIVTELAGGIAEPLGETRGTRIEEDACGLERACGQHHNSGARLAVHMRGALDVIHTLGFALRVEEHVTDHGVTYQRQAPCLRSHRQRYRRAVEVRRRVAATLAFVAVVARWSTAVHDRQVRHAIGHHYPAEFLADHGARQPPPA